MEKLYFILWMCLFPLTVSIGQYFDAKRKIMQKKEPYSDGVNAFGCFMAIVIWFVVGGMLY